MFLNKTKFKKWIKDAYNRGGLTVGRIHDGLVICGPYWTTWTEDGYIPNWVKAAVMEYTGELPKDGCVFKAIKNEPLQYEISENSWFNLPEMYQKAKTVFTVTPVTYDHKWEYYRFLQNNQTKEVVAMREESYQIIDEKELEEERPPFGPCAITPEAHILLWKNEHSALGICKMDISEAGLKIIGLLETMDFEKEAD